MHGFHDVCILFLNAFIALSVFHHMLCLHHRLQLLFPTDFQTEADPIQLHHQYHQHLQAADDTGILMYPLTSYIGTND